jgi:hypothetical protein
MGNDSQKKPRSDADDQLEREIRAERKFTLTEAIGRLAGPGAMKGASPVTRKHQVEVEIETWLRQHLADAQGALQSVLLRRVAGNGSLLQAQDSPLKVFASYCQQVVNSDQKLQELVREVDVEWGRAFEERPHFEKEGCPPHPDDPYTLESVRRDLSGLVEQISAVAPSTPAPPQ